jgi:predicted ATPase with chaperone activity
MIVAAPVPAGPTPAPSLPTIVPHPAAPTTIEESGLSVDLVLQLALKTLHFAGELTGAALADRLCLRYPAIEPALDQLKAAHHLTIGGGSMLGGAAFRYRITDAGRARAGLFLAHNQYVGPAPVPLTAYREYLRAFMAQAPAGASRARVKRAFSDLVVSDRVIDQIGPAINAGRSLFLYGPPGNGKTAMARAIRDLLDGDLAIPHAIEVEGQIVRVFDPVHHETVLSDQTGVAGETDEDFDTGDVPDRRWVRCRRPLVMVGGELTLNSLQLGQTSGGFYNAPVQVRANGGVLVIDDFGRQQVSHTALLNRWSVPLESRIDLLSLASGQMFEVPFAVLVVFATNLRPSDLVDEAFLRRIHAKVRAQSPTAEEFALIFERYCATRGVPYDASLVDHVLAHAYRDRGLTRRACHPRDLIDQALALADYRREPRGLTPELLDAACDVYFVDDRAEAPDTE